MKNREVIQYNVKETGQFVMASEIKSGCSVYFIPGYGQSAEGSYYLLSQLFYSLIKKNVSLFCLDHCSCGDSLTFKEVVEWEDYLTGIKFFLKDTSKRKIFILTGMSIFFAPLILDKGFKYILLPPYPEYLSIVDRIVNDLDHDVYDSCYLYDKYPIMKTFFEMLGASWNEWKGQRVSKKLLKDLCCEVRKNVISDGEIRRNALAIFEIQQLNEKLGKVEGNRCYLGDSFVKYGVLSPEDREIIKKELSNIVIREEKYSW